MKSIAAVFLLGMVRSIIAAIPQASAAERPEPTAALQSQIARLEKENDALRAENAVLRRLLVAPTAEARPASVVVPDVRPAVTPVVEPACRLAVVVPDTVLADKPPVVPAAPVAQNNTNAPQSEPVIELKAEEPAYWMSYDGKRHNSKCRYYRTGSGRYCGPKVGEPCKGCGG